MPLGDKTGPRGMGPRTGRGLGDCEPEYTPETKPKKQNEEFEEDIKYPRFVGRSFDFGRGLGRGRGFRRF